MEVECSMKQQKIKNVGKIYMIVFYELFVRIFRTFQKLFTGYTDADFSNQAFNFVVLKLFSF